MCRNLVLVIVQYFQLTERYRVENWAIQKLAVAENSMFNNTLTQLNIRQLLNENKIKINLIRKIFNHKSLVIQISILSINICAMLCYRQGRIYNFGVPGYKMYAALLILTVFAYLIN